MSERPWRDKEKIREEYVEGERSIHDIADEWDCAPKTVSNWVKRHGFEMRSPGGVTDDRLRDEEWLQEKYHGEDLSQSEIAEILGCHQHSVGRKIREFGIETKTLGEHQTPTELKDADELERLYWEEELSTYDIADRFDTTYAAVRYNLIKNGIELRERWKSGEDNPNWKGGYDYYYGPDWPEQREKALKRDGYECRRCGISNEEHKQQHPQNASLEVHHITPFIEFDDHAEANRLENLIALCSTCHRLLEGVPIDQRHEPS